MGVPNFFISKFKLPNSCNFTSDILKLWSKTHAYKKSNFFVSVKKIKNKKIK